MKQNKLKKYFPYIINIIIVTLILLISLKLNKIYPFGNFDLAKYDATYQYKPFLYDFITSIKDGTISSYNFNNGLGNATIFNYLYYLASPLNLIALLFKNPDSMFFSIILLKVILTSVFSTFYFQKKSNNTIAAIICPISYVFSGWFLAYYFNIMWLDSFMIFPLLQYGLEQLIEKNKCNIYIFSLAYIMLTNFYMAFMICIYILFYFIFYIIFRHETFKTKLKNFNFIFLSTLITCLLSSFTIYATYSSFLKMGIYINDVESSIKLNIFTMIKSLLYGNINNNAVSNIGVLPNICTSLLFLISLLYYFINSKIKLREKIMTIVAIIFTFLIFSSNLANYYLNCFHNPIGYTYRYSFIFSFYILIIFLRNLNTFDQKIDLKIYIINIIIFLILLIELLTKNTEYNLFIFNLVFLLSYTILFLFYNNDKSYKILFITIVILECFISTYHSFTNNNEIKTYPAKIDNVEYRTKIDDTKFYANNINNNLYSKTSTLETFSSMQYINTIRLLNKLGCSTDMKAMVYSCHNNQLFNMLFNVNDKYLLPKLYIVNKDIYLYDIDNANYIENQTNLVKGMTNIDHIFNEEKLKYQSTNPYIYKIKKNQEYIISINPNMKYLKIKDTIYVNNVDDVPPQYKNLNINTDLLRKIMIIEPLKSNDQIEIEYHEEKDIDDQLILYYLDDDRVQNVYNLLNKNVEIISYQNDYIEAEVTLNDNELIFTTIPYDKSWQVTVDDVKVEPTPYDQSLMLIDINPGTHKIKLKYKNNFTIPIIISIITFIILILNIINKKVSK